MRQFDAFNSYVGEGGKPLVGRILFYDINSQPKSVYDANGVDLGYKITVELCGRASKQVFLADADYIVTFQQKNGDGSYYSIGSVLNKMPSLNIIGDQASGPIPSVATKAALVALDPAGVTSIGGKKIVQMLGYNSSGDKPSVYYWWNAESVASDNGGSVIGSGVSVTGKWEIIASFEDVDCRHFGVFPKVDSIDNYTNGYLDHRNRIGQLATYAYSVGKKIYFCNSSNQSAWYDIGGATIYGVNADSNVTIAVSHGFTGTVRDVSPDLKFKSIANSNYTGVNSGKISVYGRTLKTSQDITDNTSTYNQTSQLWEDAPSRSSVTLHPSETLIIDNNYAATEKTFNGLHIVIPYNVMMTVPVSNTFYSCTFSGVGKLFLSDITAYTFAGCKITQSMVDITSGFGAATFNGCRAESSDWNNNQYWYEAQKTVNNSNVIDMTGRTMTGTMTIVGDLKIIGGTWENLTFFKGGSGCSIQDAVITGTLQQNNWQNLKLKHCTIGSLTGGGLGLDAYDCLFTPSGSLNCSWMKLDKCTVNGNIIIYSGSSLTDCKLNGNVTITSQEDSGLDEERIQNIVMTGNTLMTGSVVKFQGSLNENDKTYVTNVWVHNNFIGNLSTIVNQGYFKDVQGFYSFDNNVGNGVSWDRTNVSSMAIVNRSLGEMKSENATRTDGNVRVTGKDGSNWKAEVMHPCLADIVWNFGERYNLCNFGSDKFISRSKLNWHYKGHGLSEDVYEWGSSSDFDTGRIWWSDEKMVEHIVSCKGTGNYTGYNDLYVGIVPETKTNCTRNSFGPVIDINEVRLNVNITPCK